MRIGPTFPHLLTGVPCEAGIEPFDKALMLAAQETNSNSYWSAANSVSTDESGRFLKDYSGLFINRAPPD